MRPRLALGLLPAALALLAMPPRPAPGMTLGEIRILNQGPGPLAPESVLSLLSLREGRPFDRAAVIADTRRLQATGRFSQVEILAEALEETAEVRLTVVLRNKPRLARWTVEGSSALGNRRIAELAGLRLGDPVDEDNLAAGALRIRDEYLKRYRPYAKVSWTIDTDEETGRAEVRLRIREGPRVRVTAIRIRGLERVPEEALRQALRQTVFRSANPWHWIRGRGRYDPDGAEAEALTLRRALLDLGHLDAEVEGPEIRRVGRRIEWVFTVREGALYRIGSVSLAGHTLFEEPVLERVHGLRPGDPASLRRMDEAAAALQDHYADRGYYRTRVDRAVDAEAATGRADVRFRIEEGRLSRVRDLRIEGNRVTRDTVIRRELVIAPGDRLDRSRVRASERRLRNLGYFTEVSSAMAETPQRDDYDLIFQVEEGQMGMAAAGIGFTSIERVSGYVEVSHGNFALGDWPPFGGGQKLRLRTQVGSRSNTVETEFIEPWFLNRPLSLGVHLFRSESRYLSRDYNQRNTGGRLSLTRALDAFWRGSVEYGLQGIEILDVDPAASPAIREEEGRRIKSALTLAATRDTRRMDYRGALPRGGNFLRLSATLSGGPLGGDTDLYELSAHGSQFLPVVGRQVLVLRGRVGVVDGLRSGDRVPLFDRFFLGGPTNVRGFPYRGIGPRDENQTATGGRSLAFASAEYSVPLVQGIRGAAFYDTGKVWEDAYQFDSEWFSSYGVGMRLDIPMLPIQLDYAWPLEADEWARRKRGRFSFWIGHSF